MISLNYRMCDPTGNITAIVLAPLDLRLRREISDLIMHREPSCEQVGYYLSPGVGGADAALTMAGGEFCGNATMSAAAVLAEGLRLPAGETRECLISVSGARLPVPVRITARGGSEYYATVTMPPADSIEMLRLDLDTGPIPVCAVSMPGITHIIITQRLARAQAERAVVRWCRQLKVPALGIMQLDETHGSLEPLVYVPKSGTVFWEHSCASGTSAVGAFLAQRDGRDRILRLRQPGGMLDIDAEYRPDGGGRLLLSGTVSLASPLKSLDFPES